ncbi:hypothetical protein J2X53_003928 [Pseudorhodobacter sp. 4114]|nr:hypothetical protein [Pseudorhodobacter sp. 4114]
MLLEEFEKCELTKSDLAKMLNKRPEQITRWLGGPGNLTLDTLSELVFAMRGKFVGVELVDELAKAKSNQKRPEWVKSAEFKGYRKTIQASEQSSQWVLSVRSQSKTVSKITSDEVKYDTAEYAI